MRSAFASLHFLAAHRFFSAAVIFLRVADETVRLTRQDPKIVGIGDAAAGAAAHEPHPLAGTRYRAQRVAADRK